MKPKVLWIEDGARYELASLCGPVFYKNTCDLTLAEDVSTAVDHLCADEWDALIVDIRLPPGVNRTWRRLYREAGSDKVHAQLGLKLLRWLLSGDREVFDEGPPEWIRPERVAVFTVESRQEVGQHLDVHLEVDLGPLSPEDVLTELVVTRNGSDAAETIVVPMKHAGVVDGSVHGFDGGYRVERAGQYQYGMRVRVPGNGPHDAKVRGLVLWA